MFTMYDSKIVYFFFNYIPEGMVKRIPSVRTFIFNQMMLETFIPLFIYLLIQQTIY